MFLLTLSYRSDCQSKARTKRGGKKREKKKSMKARRRKGEEGGRDAKFSTKFLCPVKHKARRTMGEKRKKRKGNQFVLRFQKKKGGGKKKRGQSAPYSHSLTHERWEKGGGKKETRFGTAHLSTKKKEGKETEPSFTLIYQSLA